MGSPCYVEWARLVLLGARGSHARMMGRPPVRSPKGKGHNQGDVEDALPAEVNLFGSFALPVSSILHATAMLHSLSLRPNATMDEEALIGVSNGTLGRFLRKLEIDIRYDVVEVLDMMEARKQTVDRLIKNGCSWKEAITSVKDVVIHTTDGEDYKERIIALEEAGIHIPVS